MKSLVQKATYRHNFHEPASERNVKIRVPKLKSNGAYRKIIKKTKWSGPIFKASSTSVVKCTVRLDVEMTK